MKIDISFALPTKGQPGWDGHDGSKLNIKVGELLLYLLCQEIAIFSFPCLLTLQVHSGHFAHESCCTLIKRKVNQSLKIEKFCMMCRMYTIKVKSMVRMTQQKVFTKFR